MPILRLLTTFLIEISRVKMWLLICVSNKLKINKISNLIYHARYYKRARKIINISDITQNILFVVEIIFLTSHYAI